MTVSMEVAVNRHVGFQISRTIRCFWHSLYLLSNTALHPRI